MESAVADLVAKLLGMVALALSGAAIEREREQAADAKAEAAVLERVAQADAVSRAESYDDKLQDLKRDGLL